jgi:hypothetical protein
VTSHGVYQADGNPNDVTAYHEFGTMQAAKAFAGSARLQEVMKSAGVQGFRTYGLQRGYSQPPARRLATELDVVSKKGGGYAAAPLLDQRNCLK